LQGLSRKLKGESHVTNTKIKMHGKIMSADVKIRMHRKITHEK